MKTDLFVLQICDFLNDGDGYYRLHEPSRQLSRLPGVLVVDCHFYHRHVLELARLAHVVVLPFVHNWDYFPLIESRRQAGQITVFEANDYFFDVQPWSPVASGWQDRAIQEEYRLYMEAADAVQTSSHELARRWSSWAKETWVFENHLVDIPQLQSRGSRPLTIGWGGSPGHFADWFALAPVLESWLASHPDVHLAVMTNEFAKPFLRLSPDRYHFTPFGSLKEYTSFLPSLDIGLAPLLPSDYNRCRSDVKFLEYAAHGIPGIYSDLEPYRRSVRHGETGLLYRNRGEFVDCLNRLTADESLRNAIRGNAHRYVSEHRRLPERVSERLECYLVRLGGKPLPIDVPDACLASAERDGNYLQLRPEGPERALLECLNRGTTPESLAQLRSLVREWPAFVPALQSLGRMLNDSRDSAAALHVLAEALRLQETSALTLCEIGRAWFLQRNISQARQYLDRALEVNPRYFPGWQYLLRLLAIEKAPDGAKQAAEALNRFPNDYMLALQSIACHPRSEAIAILQSTLDRFRGTFSLEEMPRAASAFSRAALEIDGSALASVEGRRLLEEMVRVFPDSARCADLLGRVEWALGDTASSLGSYERALTLRQAAQTFRNEFPKEDGSLHYWQFAQHIHRYPPDLTP